MTILEPFEQSGPPNLAQSPGSSGCGECLTNRGIRPRLYGPYHT